MSQVDHNIVRMEFDNQEFEKGIKTSLESLQNLKGSLEFEDSGKSLNGLNKAINSLSFQNLFSNVESLSDRFTNLGIMGMRMIENFADSIYNNFTRTLKSLTLDQFTAGFDKYATKTQAVQTILAATGHSMEVVTAELAKLNWYSDETSYDLVDMTSNIAKFTSNGIKLGPAVTAMQGIANASALAGSNVQQASHAMEGFSKAMAQGFMSRINWNWIKTSRMDTERFKQTLIDTAEEMGTLVRRNGQLVTAVKGTRVSFADFETALSEGWLTKDVMMKGLTTFGEFGVELQKISNQTDISASKLLRYLEEYEKGTIDIGKSAAESGLSITEFTDILTKLTDSSYDLGRQSFRAAQEAKTFAEAIDAVKDAVSTSWMTTFEAIFGDYDEARIMWTEFANTLYDIFGTAGELRNEMLAGWKELGGRNALIQSVKNMYKALLNIIVPIKEAFRDIFPRTTATQLYEITKRLEEFTRNLIITEESSDKIATTFRRMFAVLASIRDIFKYIATKVLSVLNPALWTLSTILRSMWSVAETVLFVFVGLTAAIVNMVAESNLLSAIFQGIGLMLYYVAVAAGYAWEAMKELYRIVGEKILTPTLELLIGFFTDMPETLNKIGDKVSAFFEKLDDDGETAFDGFGRGLEKLFEILRNADIGTVAALGSIAAIFFTVRMVLKELKILRNSLKPAKTVIQSFKGMLTAFTGAVNEYKKNMKFQSILKLAQSIAIITAALAVLTFLDTKKLIVAVLMLSGIVLLYMQAVKHMTKMENVEWKGIIATAVGFSFAIGAITKAMVKLQSVEWKNTKKSMIAFGGIILSLMGLINVLSKAQERMKDNKSIWSMVGIMLAITGVARAMKGMGDVIVKVGAMESGIIKGLWGLMSISGALLSVIVVLGLVAKFADAGNIKAVSGMLLSVTVSLLALSLVLSMLGKMDVDQFNSGLNRLANMLLSVAVGFSLLLLASRGWAKLIGVSTTLIAMAVALNLLLVPLYLLGKISEETYTTGIWKLITVLGALTLGIALLIFVAGGGVKLKGVANSILALAVAVNLILIPLAILSLIPFQKLLVGLMGLGGAIAIFAVALTFLTPTIPGILAMGAALGALGLGIGVLIGSLAIGAAVLGVFTLAFGLMVLGIRDLLPDIGASLNEFLDMLLGTADKVRELLLHGAETIGTFIGTILTSFLDHILGWLMDIFQPLFDGMWAVGSWVIGGIVGGISDSWDWIKEKNLELGGKIIDWVKEGAAKIKELGKNIVTGLREGLSEKWDKIKTTASNLGQTVINAFSKKTQIASPSKVFKNLGGFLVSGLSQGLAKGKKLLNKDGKELGGGIVSSLTGFIPSMKDSGQGLIAGFFDGLVEKQMGKNPVEDFVKNMTDEFKDAAGGGEDAGSSYMDSLSSGLKSGSGKVKTVSKEVAKTLYETTKEYIDKQKEHHGMSLEDQLSKWKSVLAQMQAESEEWYKTLREIVEVEDQIRQELFDKTKKHIENEKKFKRMSLLEEYEEWAKVQDKFAEGTKQRMDAEEELFKAREQILEKQKQIDKDYADGVKAINDRLTEDIKKANDEYDNALKNRTDSLAKAWGLFDKVEPSGGVVSGEMLIKNLENQTKSFAIWQEKIQELKDKGVSGKLLDELVELGPKSLNQVYALAKLTEPELEKYADLYGIKHQQAKDQATSELVKLKAETSSKISALRSQAQYDLDLLQAVWVEQTRELTKTVVDEYEEMGDNIIKGLQHLKKESKEEIEDTNKEIKSTINKENWASLGFNITDGIKKGIQDGKSGVVNAMTAVARAALAAAQAELDIKSPSRKFFAIGQFVVEGLANGINQNGSKAVQSTASVGKSILLTMNNLMDDITDLVMSDFDIDPVIRPVVDMSDLRAKQMELDNILSPSHSMELSRNISAREKAFMEKYGDGSKKTDISFVQNNYSPKALSRYEIYRQTRNQVSTLKGVFAN